MNNKVLYEHVSSIPAINEDIAKELNDCLSNRDAEICGIADYNIRDLGWKKLNIPVQDALTRIFTLTSSFTQDERMEA